MNERVSGTLRDMKNLGQTETYTMATEAELAKEMLGQVGVEMIESILARIPRNGSSTDKKEIQLSQYSERLSPIQKKVVERMLAQFSFDDEHLKKFCNERTKEQLLAVVDRLLAQVVERDEQIQIDPSTVDLQMLDGCLAIVFTDPAAYELHFGSLGSYGFTMRDTKPTTDPSDEDFLLGRFVVVNGTYENASRVLRHEYMHVLTANYIIPQEISYKAQMEAEVADALAPVDQSIAAVSEQINSLAEEMTSADMQDVLDIKSQIDLLKRKKKQFMKERNQILDGSTWYRSKKMYELFLFIRDELVSFGFEGVWKYEEDALLVADADWEQSIDAVPNEADKQKFLKQWATLKQVIKDLKQRQAPIARALPIFLTSQSLHEITTRLKKVYT